MNQEVLKSINARLKSDFRLVKQFGNGNSNKNYLLENSTNEKIVVKQLDNQPVDFVPIEISIQEHLNKRGITTPRIKTFNSDNEFILKIGNKDFTYTDYIESDGSLPTPFELGVNIAKFHITMKDFEYELPPNWLHPKYWSNLKFKHYDIKTSELIKDDLNTLRNQLTKLNLPKTTIHGDLNLGNVLTLNNKIVATLDLESTEKNFRILDIGMTIFQVKPNYNNLSYSELANNIILGYESLLLLKQTEKEQTFAATLYSASASGIWNLSFEADSSNFLQSYIALLERIKDGFK
ncbi:MAG: hypothetical protein QG623_97 [Patescibacteria group bacterium]|nr:hypothetical protein [Patescibacteria group bacterium]